MTRGPNPTAGGFAPRAPQSIFAKKKQRPAP